MKITDIQVGPDHTVLITAEDGRKGVFNAAPYLELDVFRPLKKQSEFVKIRNGGYFIEWECGADLSADTVEARMEPIC